MTDRALLRARAFAKINLTLRVLGRRDDGYHELRTVFQSISLHDRLTFAPTDGRFAIECRDARCPTDRTNLVWKAAELVWRAARRRGSPSGVRVFIDKRIPMQAGLGGGSSDGAAALRAFVRLWCPNLPADRIAAMAGALGADVPFFLRGGTALGVERGDRLFPLADRDPAWVVLVQPDFGIPTADAYRWFDGQVARTPSNRTRLGGPYGDGGNDLEKPVAIRHPTISAVIRALNREGAAWAAMSGSGSTCFGLFSEAGAAAAAAAALKSARRNTLVARTMTARQFATRSDLV